MTLLLSQHAQLIAASGISDAVAQARGYQSIIAVGDAIALGFASAQARVPALLVPVWGVSGDIVTYQLRPDNPRIVNGKPIKYETPKGSRMALDVPPGVRGQMGNPAVPLAVTEGVRKDDSAVSHDVCCIAVLGVWNWRGRNDDGGTTALADWESIALNGRTVFIAFDSDVMTKPEVALALRRLCRFLESRKARVQPLYLPPAPDGGKQGLDDYLAAGGTPVELFSLVTKPRAEREQESPSKEWRPRMTLLADVQPEPVSWLWTGYIPRGKLVLLDGDPGMGKSTLCVDLAARVSTGAKMPDDTGSDLDCGTGVVILSGEDGLADTIRPRLDAAGADTSRIVTIESVVSGEHERGVTLADLPAIEEAIATVDARLVIIDPLMAYLGRETNSYRDQDVRGILAPLARLAERLDVAIVVVRHLTKGANANVLYRGGGSIGIIGAARVALMVGCDPDDPDGPRRIFAVAKSNLAALPPAFAYHMEHAENGTARIVWEEATHHTAAAITAAPAAKDQGGQSALDRAKDILQTILGAGAVASKEAEQAAIGAGCTASTIRRAREALGIKPHRIGGAADKGEWVWELPTTDTAAQEPPKLLNQPLSCSPKKDEQLSTRMSILGDNPLTAGVEQEQPDAVVGQVPNVMQTAQSSFTQARRKLAEYRAKYPPDPRMEQVFVAWLGRDGFSQEEIGAALRSANAAGTEQAADD